MADAVTIGVQLASTLAQAGGSIMAANSAADAAKFEAAQLERDAKAAEARASYEAAEEGRQRRLKLSRAQAVGAASGSDRDFAREGEIEAEGRYRSLMALFEGTEIADGRRTQAAASRYDADVARRAGFIKAGGSVLSGATSLLDKYGGGLDRSNAPATSRTPRSRPKTWWQY